MPQRKRKGTPKKTPEPKEARTSPPGKKAPASKGGNEKAKVAIPSKNTPPEPGKENEKEEPKQVEKQKEQQPERPEDDDPEEEEAEDESSDESGPFTFAELKKRLATASKQEAGWVDRRVEVQETMRQPHDPGVFVATLVKKGELLLVWKPLVVGQEEFDRRSEYFQRMMEETSVYRNPMVSFRKRPGGLDCTYYYDHPHNPAMRINHSRTRANVECCTARDPDDENTVFQYYVALRDIKPKEELLEDYGTYDPKLVKQFDWLKSQ